MSLTYVLMRARIVLWIVGGFAIGAYLGYVVGVLILAATGHGNASQHQLQTVAGPISIFGGFSGVTAALRWRGRRIARSQQGNQAPRHVASPSSAQSEVHRADVIEAVARLAFRRLVEYAIGIAFFVLIGLAIYHHFKPSTQDPYPTVAAIQAKMVANTDQDFDGTNVVAKCPAQYPHKAGATFDCIVTTSVTQLVEHVTVNDHYGVSWTTSVR